MVGLFEPRVSVCQACKANHDDADGSERRPGVYRWAADTAPDFTPDPRLMPKFED